MFQGEESKQVSKTANLSPIILFHIIGSCLELLAHWSKYINPYNDALISLINRHNEHYKTIHACLEEKKSISNNYSEETKKLCQETCNLIAEGKENFSDHFLQSSCAVLLDQFLVLKSFKINNISNSYWEKLSNDINNFFTFLKQKSAESTPAISFCLLNSGALEQDFPAKLMSAVDQIAIKLEKLEKGKESIFSWLWKKVYSSKPSEAFYKPFLHYASLFKPETALELFEQLYQQKQQDLAAEESALRQLSPQTIRSQFRLNVHQAWQNNILTNKEKWGKVSPLDLKINLTSGKKQFYKKIISQTRPIMMRKKVLEAFNKNGCSTRKTLENLSLCKQQVVESIFTIEKELTARLTLCDNVKAFLQCASRYHVGFQQAYLNARLLDNVGGVDHDLDAELKLKAERLAGYTCIAIDILIACYTDNLASSYELIKVLNQLLLSEVNALFKLSAFLEQPLQQLTSTLKTKSELPILPRPLRFTFKFLSEKISIDELDIIEYDDLLSWSNGLLINCALVLLSTGSTALIPATFAYASATACQKIICQIINSLQSVFPYSDDTKNILMVLTSLGVYRLVYCYAIEAVANYFSAPVYNKALSEVQAYTLLGVSEGSSQRQIRESFKQLALANHPDKCKYNCTSMALLNEAYRLLKK